VQRKTLKSKRWNKKGTGGFFIMQGFSPRSIWVVREDEMSGARGTYGEKRHAQ